MHLHRHSLKIRGLLAWLFAGLFFLPFTAMGGIHCEHRGENAVQIHCQHGGEASVMVSDAADEDACCCNTLFHALGCQHHCQTAGQASLIATSPCPFPFVGQVWLSPIVDSLEDSFLEPPYHPPRT